MTEKLSVNGHVHCPCQGACTSGARFSDSEHDELIICQANWAKGQKEIVDGQITVKPLDLASVLQNPCLQQTNSQLLPQVF